MSGLDDEADDFDFDFDRVVCIFCGMKIHTSKAWSHIDGDSNLGVKKIEYFCSEEHKSEYFRS